MIPVKLELSNFLSYRDKTTLDFAGIHTACIAGANGAGKSSILDGMTWALFGQSRSKSDDDVVNRIAAANDKPAEVRFTFQFEGNTYRVIRRKQFNKVSKLELQLQIEEGKWKALSERRLRDTQESIEQLLRMNYDTFTNASFLLQGKADEFTTKTPSQRKQILAELIGANEWDTRKEQVTERRKQEEGKIKLIEGSLQEIGQEISETEERQSSLTEAQEAHAQIKARLDDKEKLLLQVRQQAEQIKHQKQRMQDLAVQVERAQHTLEKTQKTYVQRQQERERYAGVLAQADSIQQQYAYWEQVETVWQGWQEKEKQYRTLERAQQPYQVTIAQTESRLQQQQSNLQTQAKRVTAMQTERTQVQKQLDAGKTNLTQIQTQLAVLMTQEQAWQSAKTTLQEMRGTRQLKEQEVQQLQKEEKQVALAKKEQLDVHADLTMAEAEVKRLQAELAHITVQTEQRAQAQTDHDRLQIEQPRLKESMTKLKERMDKLETETGTTCPLCGQLLTAEHRQTILTDLQSEGETQAKQFRQNKEQIKALGQEIKIFDQTIQQRPHLEREQQNQQQRLAIATAKLEENEKRVKMWEAEGVIRLGELQEALTNDEVWQLQQKEVATLEKGLSEKPMLEKQQQQQQKEIATAEARLTEIDRTLSEWEKEGKRNLATITQQLISHDFAHEARQALAKLQTEAIEIGYDVETHEAMTQERKELAKVPATYQSLKQAEAAVAPLDTNIADLAHQIKEQESYLDDMTQQRDTEQTRLTEMAANQPDLIVLEKEVFKLREEEIAGNRRVGAAKQRVDILEDVRQRQAQLLLDKETHLQLINRLKLLEKACGRDGVQALLIEQALPEIEYYANDLLEQLSDGRMSIYFATQKQLKSRQELAETLDIRIVDEAGERPYENFSGGEQFRVNFAIRLALSKLLSKRAGTRLQTLVIDEGFGSQDPQGRQRLVEAIHTVEDEFACLLIITHVDELRDAFDTRIEVNKGNQGSSIIVN